MATVPEEIAGDLGEQLIGLSRDPQTSLNPRAFDFVDLIINLDSIPIGGLVLPVELTVSPANNLKNYQRKYFRKFLPEIVTVRVLDSGPHTVRIAEVGHMRSYGEITFEVR